MLPLLLLAILGVSQAQHYCCGPPQWEATLGQLEGYYNPDIHKPGIIQGVDIVSFDYTNQRMKSVSYLTSDGKPIPQIDIYTDYKKRVQYKVQNNNCTMSPVPNAMPSPCIPATANFTGSTYFGVGRDKLMLDSWLFNFPGARLFLTTTQNGCYPVSEGIVGEFSNAGTISQCKENCVDAIFAYGITGLTVGIKDLTVFDLPASCQSPEGNDQAVTGHTVGHMSHEIRRRFA